MYLFTQRAIHIFAHFAFGSFPVEPQENFIYAAY